MVDAVSAHSATVTFSRQQVTLEQAESMLTRLIEAKPGELKDALTSGQREKFERDLKNIDVLWQSSSGRQIIMLDLTFARRQGIV